MDKKKIIAFILCLLLSGPVFFIFSYLGFIKFIERLVPGGNLFEISLLIIIYNAPGFAIMVKKYPTFKTLLGFSVAALILSFPYLIGLGLIICYFTPACTV